MPKEKGNNEEVNQDKQGKYKKFNLKKNEEIDIGKSNLIDQLSEYKKIIKLQDQKIK